MTADQFLDELEQKDLLPDDVLALLRRQVAAASRPVKPAKIAKLLVERNLLTAFQVRRLLPDDAPGGPVEMMPSEKKEKKPPEPSRSPARPQAATGGDTFELLPDEEEPDEEEELGIEPLEEELQEQAKKKQPAKPARPAAAGAASTSLLEEELAPLTGEEDPYGMGSLESLADAETDNPLMPTAMSAKKKKGWFGGLKRSASARSPAAGSKTADKDQEIVALPEPKGGDMTTTTIAIVAGTAVGLVILAVVLYVALGQQGGDKLYAAAVESYQSGSYTQAIESFDSYLERFPKHEMASTARVKRELARLRLDTEGTTDYVHALATANDVLENIQEEDDFSQSGAQGELASLLPAIAKGLVARAQGIEDPAEAQAAVDLASEALKLVHTPHYVPNHLKNQKDVTEIEGQLKGVMDTIGREARLQETIEQMRTAIAAGELAEAHRLRRELLIQHPEMESDEQITELVGRIAAALKKQVRSVAQAKPPLAGEADGPRHGSIVLAPRSGSAAPGLSGHVACVLAGGAVYGLNAETGAALWRYFVGFDTQAVPVPLTGEPGSDVVLVDSSRNEIVGIEAATGKVLWRHAAGGYIQGAPLVIRDRVLVALRSGRVNVIDAATGSSPSHVVIPQELDVGPGGDARKLYVYQVSDHSNLYALSAEDGTCREAIHLGHEPGTVAVPPAVVLRNVVVVENRGERLAFLHVLATDANGLSLQHVQRRRLEGHVLVPPLVVGRRMVVVTDRGGIYVFEASVGGADRSMKLLAERKPTDDRPQMRYPLEHQGQMWLADHQLANFQLQFAQGRISFAAVVRRFADHAFTQPLASRGEVLLVASRPPGRQGVVVSAVDLATGETPYWETHLAAPPATEPVILATSGRVIVATAHGELFEVPVASLPTGGVITESLVAASTPAEGTPRLVGRVDLPKRTMAFVPGGAARQVLFYDPAAADGRARWVELRLPRGDRLACEPVGFRFGLIAPAEKGQVFVFTPDSGNHTVQPFQPPQGSVGQYQWRRPAIAGANQDMAVLADGANKLYLLQPTSRPEPYLNLVKTSKELGDSIVSPVAVVGDTAYAVDAGGNMHSLKLPEMDNPRAADLGGVAVWGPQTVGDCVLVATDAGELFCFDGQPQPRWKIALPHGPLVGTPLALGGDLLLASNRLDEHSTAGVIWRIDAATGRQRAGGLIKLRDPLGCGPVAAGAKSLLVTGLDATLRTVDLLPPDTP